MSDIKDIIDSGETSISDLMAPMSSSPNVTNTPSIDFSQPQVPPQSPELQKWDEDKYNRAKTPSDLMTGPNGQFPMSPQQGTTSYPQNGVPTAMPEAFRGLRVLQNTPVRDVIFLSMLFFALQQPAFKQWFANYLPQAFRTDPNTMSMVMALIAAVIYFMAGAYL